MKYINKNPSESGYYWHFSVDYPCPQIAFFQSSINIGEWHMYASGGMSHGVPFNPERDFRSEEKLVAPAIDFNDANYLAIMEIERAKWKIRNDQRSAQVAAENEKREREELARLSAKYEKDSDTKSGEAS